MCEPARLIRFVVGPDRRVVPDIRARLPGRGAWVSLDSGTVAQAVRRKAFARSFKRECTAEADLPAQVDRLLEQDALQALSFANKAGHVVCGAVKIESALAGGAVRGILHAVDGSPDGVRKIRAAARRRGGGSDAGPAHLQIFSSSQLDLALGRSNVIHAALLAGGAGEAVLARAIRLGSFRGSGPVEGAETLGDTVTDAI